MVNVTLVKWQEGPDYFRCTVSDERHRHHTVEIPRSMLAVEAPNFSRGSDAEHIGIIAAGAVLLDLDPDNDFHKVDRSMVIRAYTAASEAQILGRFGN
ncbi:MAG: hypothetical protein JSS75_06320 [Bacteroidetes bacterium]|nr:hypothetical protein [Bacteroidota bacterium]